MLFIDKIVLGLPAHIIVTTDRLCLGNDPTCDQYIAVDCPCLDPVGDRQHGPRPGL